jgi:ADP-heptose:LPS heptosyltransferase
MNAFYDKGSREHHQDPVIQSTNESGWTDAMGFTHLRPVIKSILCLKFDHIGDILVADFSFRIIDKYFPGAHVTLICGEWNVELAESLGIADKVIGVSLFNPHGADQHDERAAMAARKAGLTRLLQVAKSLPAFDMAIDMRIDEDTRDLLKFFEAKVYVGSGDLSKYPFLDVSVPLSEPHLNQVPNSCRLMPRDFITGSGYEIGTFGLGFPSAVLSIPLKFEIDGAKSPIECGTSQDDSRLLGVGIERIRLLCEVEGAEPVVLKDFSFELGSKDCQFLSSGWAISESWGTWSNEKEATIVLSCRESTASGRLKLQIHCRGHTNQGNKRVTLKALDLTSDETVSTSCEFPDNQLELTLPVTGQRHFGAAKTRPIYLRAGQYSIAVETFTVATQFPTSLSLSILGTGPERTIQAYDMILADSSQSRRNFVFELDHRDSNEPLQVQLEAGTSGHPLGMYITSISCFATQSAPAKVPESHMEKRIARLVMSAALEFSQEFDPLYKLAEDSLKVTGKRAKSPVLLDFESHLDVKRKDYKVVGLSIGATKETKKWPFSYVIELCESLLARPDVYLVLVGGPNDLDDTTILERALSRPERVLNFCGKTKLADFGAVLAKFDLYIGYDTGTTHYAGKVGLRTIGIFSAVHSPREWGPVGRKASWITHYTDCSPCYLAKLDECRYGHACMLELRPADCWPTITEALDALTVAKGPATGRDWPTPLVSPVAARPLLEIPGGTEPADQDAGGARRGKFLVGKRVNAPKRARRSEGVGVGVSQASILEAEGEAGDPATLSNDYLESDLAALEQAPGGAGRDSADERLSERDFSYRGNLASVLDDQISFEIGRTYKASVDPEFAAAFVDGWFGVEPSGIWCGVYGTMRVSYVRATGGAYYLEFLCRINSEQEEKIVDVIADGENTVMKFPSIAWETKEIDLFAREFDDVCVANISFRCPSATFPINTTNINDGRILGLMISSFAIKRR